jgi:hypothetical protein
VGEVMSDRAFMNSIRQLEFAVSMIEMVLKQAHEDDKTSLEFSAIRMSTNAIVNQSEDKDKCLLRIHQRLNKIISEVQPNG